MASRVRILAVLFFCFALAAFVVNEQTKEKGSVYVQIMSECMVSENLISNPLDYKELNADNINKTSIGIVNSDELNPNSKLGGDILFIDVENQISTAIDACVKYVRTHVFHNYDCVSLRRLII
jgi:hypothetical protein